MSVPFKMGCGTSRPIRKKKHFLGISLKKKSSTPIIIIPERDEEPNESGSSFFVDEEFDYLEEHPG